MSVQKNHNNNWMNVPPRWLKCPRRGQIVANKFIPFKTPLDNKYDSQIPPQDLFTPQMFLSCLSGLKIKLGLWIDLTFTSRFYERTVVEDKVKYTKFQCRGHDECPTVEQTVAFINICKNFITQNPMDVIGVHCTHGFNRTGFLICAYLIEIESWSVEAAIAEFAKARSPGIYKEDYLRELFSRYGDIEDMTPPPPLPEWCNESDDTDDDGKRINGNSNRSHGNSKYNYVAKSTFVEGVTGATPVFAQPRLGDIQKKCQKLCKWGKGGFPGAQPVSMDRNNITLLNQKGYKVSWKADGTRYMMLIDGKDNVFCIDRDNCVFQISGLTFPKRKEPERHLQNTLVDGEMIVDEVNGVKVPRYLIYDIIMFDSKEVGGTDFDRRLFCIQKEIIEPREEAKRNGRIDRSSEPFSVRKKDFWDLSFTKGLLSDKFNKNLSHEIDGLIFQPLDPYKPGQCDDILKWKPSTHNSVDFRLQIMREDKPGMLRSLVGYLFVGGADVAFATIKVTKDLKAYDKKIIECTYDAKSNQWVFMRERTDKSFPNSYRTAASVCHSITHPVTKEGLLGYIENFRWQKPFSVTPAPKRPSSSSDHPVEGDRSLMPPPAKAPRKV